MLAETQSRALELLAANESDKDRRHLEIMEHVRSKFLWSERFEALESAFAEAIKRLRMRADPKKPFGPGNRVEAKILMVLGETGAGKTRSLKRLFDDHPAFPGYDQPRSGCPLVSVRVRAPTTFTGLGRQILSNLGYPVHGQLDRTLVWERVHERIAFCGILVLHFDEMHNLVLKANEIDRTDVQNALKTMTTDPNWPIALVVSGLPLLADFLEEAGEDRRRALTIHFEPIAAPHDCVMVKDMAKALATVASLGFPDTIATPLMPRLFHASLYQLGTTLELVHEAIEHALRIGEDTLRREHFATAYVRRTACGPAANPFLADTWLQIDCSRVLQKTAASSTDKTPAERIKAHRNRAKGTR